MSKVPHSGNILITLLTGIKIMVEVKNYNKIIDQEQIDKLKFDMRYNNIKGALFVSLNSGIVGKKNLRLNFLKIMWIIILSFIYLILCIYQYLIKKILFHIILLKIQYKIFQ